VAIVVWVCVFGLGLYWLKRDAQKEKKGVLSMALERVQKMHINNRRIP
jgi:hypothetical protein